MSLQDLLAELQKTYLATLPEKVLNLETLWKTNQVELLETEYHKLKGTGRTYGLPEVTQVGEAMEHLCGGVASALDQAVPLSLILLTRIHVTRNGGHPLKVETEPEFQTIIALTQPENRK